jgi:hypothetical protein
LVEPVEVKPSLSKAFFTKAITEYWFLASFQIARKSAVP